MRKENGSSWDGVFLLPGFNEESTSVPSSILNEIEIGQQTQVVRDQLKGAITIFVLSSQVNLQGCKKLRWDLRWENTPQGNVAAHYLFMDNGKFLEQFIPHLSGDEPRVNDNYWLLMRLARVSFCIIAVIDGTSIIRSERYIFSQNLTTTLKKMEKDLIKNGPAKSISQVEQAAQWYMQNSDENSLKY